MKSGKYLDTNSKRELRPIWDKFVIPLMVTIIGGLIVTISGGLVQNSILQKDNTPNGEVINNESTSASKETKELLTSIQKLSIGSSKDWVDDRLGPPYSENVVEITENGRVWPDTDENNIIGAILESVYIFDAVSVIVYFDMDEKSCQAFFVTLMEDISEIDIVMPEAYAFCVFGKPLGEFTFSDIWNGWEPLYIDGYTSNGVGRVFYGEQHSFGGSGNYHDFYFACLDYGLLDSLSEFDSLVSSVYFDIFEYNDSGNFSEILAKLRSDLHPNTYGISDLNPDLTFSLFDCYMGFDSVSFRKRDQS